MRMPYAKDVVSLANIPSILSDDDLVASMRQEIQEGVIYVIKNVVDSSFVKRVIGYLQGIGSNSLPNYCAIEAGCPNFHRLNSNDERAFVGGCFHQFSFFPWNQDVFELFRVFRDAYMLKNRICNQPAEKFLGRAPEDGCTARLTFQFYPAGVGGMNVHQDPVGPHQLAVPSLTMSKKGTDFSQGGAFVMDGRAKMIFTDEISEPGDLVLFNAQIPHGVDTVDPESSPDWLSFKGRWVMLVATNKLQNQSVVSDSVDLKAGK
jgi:hypothetical protein